jgi:hypothetical protein
MFQSNALTMFVIAKVYVRAVVLKVFPNLRFDIGKKAIRIDFF